MIRMQELRIVIAYDAWDKHMRPPYGLLDILNNNGDEIQKAIEELGDSCDTPIKVVSVDVVDWEVKPPANADNKAPEGEPA